MNTTRCKLSYYDDGLRRDYDLDDAELVIGSAPDVELQADELGVAAHHFAIRRDGIGYLLRDLGSDSGTRIGETEVDEIYLRPGSVIRAGDAVFHFDYVDATLDN